MKKTFFFASFLYLILIYATPVLGQSQSGCTITFPNNFDAQVTISAIYNPALCGSGNLVLSNLNDKLGLSTVTFDADITLNSLTLNYKDGNNPLEVIIPVGVDVVITNGLDMNLNSAVQDKFLTINGSLDVGGTLDFGGIDLELDGTGTISAGAITGADDTSCSAATGGTGTCPNVSAETCDDGTGTFCTSEPTVTLPIELLFFKSSVKSEGVALAWATAKEDNFDYFSVERSRNGSDYEEIAQVKGAGFSRSILNYGFTDINSLNGKAYYRLKAIDQDLAFEYSQPIVVNTKGGVNNSITLSPNPIEGTKFNIVAENVEGEAKVLVYNMSGTLVKQLPYVSGTSLDLGSNLKPGIYMVVLNANQSQSKAKLIVK